MMFFRIVTFLCVFFLLCACAAKGNPTSVLNVQKGASAPASKKTVIESRAEARQLLGKHKFTNDNLCCRYIASAEYFGEAIIYEDNGLYRIHGGHEGYYRMRFHDPFGGGSLKIEGTITDIQNNSFTFEGIIETSVLYRNRFYTCPRKGVFRFSRSDNPEYWDYYEYWPASCPTVNPNLDFLQFERIYLYSENIPE